MGTYLALWCYSEIDACPANYVLVQLHYHTTPYLPLPLRLQPHPHASENAIAHLRRGLTRDSRHLTNVLCHYELERKVWLSDLLVLRFVRVDGIFSLDAGLGFAWLLESNAMSSAVVLRIETDADGRVTPKDTHSIAVKIDVKALVWDPILETRGLCRIVQSGTDGTVRVLARCGKMDGQVNELNGQLTSWGWCRIRRGCVFAELRYSL